MNPLIGLWKLHSFVMRDQLGNLQYPLDQDPIGYIHYLENGFMMVQLGKRQRPITHAHSPLDLKLDDDLLKIVSTYNSYCGRYEIKNDEVLHHVELSFFPNWSGQTVRRKFKIENAMLYLSDDFLVEDKNYIFEVIWYRNNI